MKLGELEFKAEDFAPPKGLPQVDIIHIDVAVEIANRILREKLEKAPKMFGAGVNGDRVWATEKYELHNHTARLVCIAPIGASVEKLKKS